ncbi:MAG: bifunctional diaminohydroxyphosphoribosylaminopyrimidine deaminase/5-amino-6-(5-phosphoribosylamino)uracil reductase RibD [Deltaproteobacteria bacterium]|nr:bifunctional diaminohydroxyphosphoribosylaminopyrimidine deaminase/5-amino-6-(5-phosphoribosylamino)uracil reductase RibD [Deltaproteobacteria bacterium]
MREALRLAERGRGSTKPNPVVGAVLVKGGKILARGFHRRAGQPHAEIEALAKVSMRAAGATLYVTLEPCCHKGRTEPCTQAILRSGVRRVVVGCCDENPLVSGRGIATLRRGGVIVRAGCLKEECRRQNRAFFTWIRGRRPWVTLKAAATLDGCIGDRTERRLRGTSRWITGRPARAAAHQLRAEHDAVLVGVGTVLADNPRLTVRLCKTARQPLHVVLDSHLRTPPAAALLRTSLPALIVAATPKRPDRALAVRQRWLTAAGAEVVFLPPDRDGRPALPALLRLLAAREVQSLLVEGGGRIHGAFVRAGLVDSVAVFLAPRLVGSGVPIVEGLGLDWRRPALLGPISVRGVGEDVLLTADVVDRGHRRRT